MNDSKQFQHIETNVKAAQLRHVGFIAPVRVGEGDGFRTDTRRERDIAPEFTNG